MGDVRKCASCGASVPDDAPGGVCPKCALAGALPGALADPTPEEVAAKLPAFEILGVLGRGGMGVVFKARQKALDRVVALKVLPPATAKAPGFAERFVREAKAMARLQHPNIVAVHEFGETDGLCWLVLEYVDGLNVREAMRAGRIGPAEALTIVPQICDALQYAHDRGVVHRDIKPENVMIDRDGRVRIADFGLAKLADRDTGDPSLTGASQVMGTLHYMAPEQWERPKDVDHRCDIYSLGVVFYEMLTGELPVGRFEPPSRRAAIDVRVDDVVMRSLERNREQRWQRADDVKTKVSAITSSPSVAAPVPPPASPVSVASDAKRAVRPTGLGSAILGALAAFAFIAALISGVGWLYWLGGIAAFASVACFAVWIAWDKDAAAATPKKEYEATFSDAAFAALVAIALGIWAAAAHEPGLWWGAGMTAFAAAAVALQAMERRHKEAAARGGPARPGISASAWLEFIAGACAALAGAVLITALVSVGVAGVAAALGEHDLRHLLWAAPALAAGLWWGRSYLANDRGDAAAPRRWSAREIAVTAAPVVVAVGLAWVFAPPLQRREGTPSPSGDRGSTPPAAAPADEHATWEFELGVPSGENAKHVPREADRQGIWRTWTRAQALQSTDWSSDLAAVYDDDDSVVVDRMKPEQRKSAASSGSLGVPLLPRETATLTKFRISRVRFGGWDESMGCFMNASAEATDGAKTLRFSMRNSVSDADSEPEWGFVAAPVEIR
jgi:hypothetical protein